MAPSAINLQPWKFYVITDKEKIRHFSNAIAEIAKPFFHLLTSDKTKAVADPVFHDAPVVIFLVAPKEDQWSALDLGMCAQNMMLAASSLGLATCPIGFAALLENAPSISELHLSKNDRIYLALTLGYGNESPEVHPRAGENVFYL
jgi:nitroreductase